MGMFDYVTLPEPFPCPKCGAPLREFQSKDGGCYLDHLTPADVDNFYAICDACKTWVEFNRTVPAPKPAGLEHFTMTSRPSGSPAVLSGE